MTTSSTRGGSRRWLPALLLTAALAGCATRTTITESVGDGKDIVTASDESDASKRAQLRMELATGYFGRGQMTTALDQVKLALQADPNLASAYNLRGLIYANLSDDKLAEESFRRALQLNPHDADTMQNFGYYLCQKKRFPEAGAMFDQALAVPQYRQQSRTMLTKGVCEGLAGQLPEAEATLLQAFRLDPTNPTTAVNLSEVLYRRGDYERARFYIRRVNGFPALTSAQTLWLAARIEHGAGNLAGAQQLGEQLRQRYPNSREAASFERGKYDE